LLKREQLKKNPFDPVAVRQPQVSAGELVDSEARLLVSAVMAREEGRDMVKPPLRTKSIGFKVSEEEYGRLETAAQASGRTLGEWCREVILRGGSASDDPALAEIVGVRLLLVNVLRPLAAGEKLAPEAFDKMLDQISEVKHQLAAKLQQQAARKKPQPEKPSGDG
jgi:hypothetical protein